MAGPTQPWDQPEDPREQTVDLPRIGPPGNGNGRAANGSHNGNPGEPDSQPPSRNGHSPAANGTPQWPVMPDSPLPRLPDVNGDPYAQPGERSRPSSLFEPPPRAAAARPARLPRPEPSMPPVPPSMPPVPSALPPSVPTDAEQPAPPSTQEQAETPPAISSTRSSAPTEAAAAESANRSETPPDATSSSLPKAEVATREDAESARAGAAAFAPPAPITPGDADVQRAAADPPAEANPAASTAQATRDQQPELAPRAAASSHGRPGRGSLADLRSRLDQLPDGHPSSPYDDGGAAKPVPHRLKQLELGLPAPERDAAETSFRFSHPIGDTSEDEQASRSRRPSGAGEPASPAAEPASPASGATSLAAKATSPADSASASETSSPNRAQGRRFDPADTGQHPYALPLPTGNDSGGPNPPPTEERNLGSDRDPSSQEPRDRDRASHDHGGHDRATREVRRTTDPGIPRHEPRPPASRSGSGDPADSHYRGDRSRSNQHSSSEPNRRGAADPVQAGGRVADNGQLSAEHRKLVAGLLADGRAAEGRASSGGYGASGLTPVIRRIADQLPGGRLAPGSEATSLKSAERLSAKLTRLIARHPDRTASELAVSICDVVRYAFAFEPESYAEGTWLVHRKLKAQGFELEARRNRWESPECKGVWTRWRDPASDLSFEIQFHTFASWDVFVSTHEEYRTITDPATSSGERARLRARQVAGTARAKAPPGCAEIVDFAKGVR